MEWATRIDNTIRGLGVQIVSETGVRMAKLSALVSGGLPSVRTHRMVIQQEIETWRVTSSSDYLVVFGINECAPQPNLHTVYETWAKDTRVLVPALVLMRAFFRPAKYLLPEMFLPQALDRVRFLDLSTPVPRVEFLRTTWRNLGDKYGDVSTPIAWMSSFPSAIAFAASVHEYAMEGRLAVKLPNARVKLAFHGQLERSTLFATNAELLEILATERPLDWAATHPRLVFRRATHVPTAQSQVLRVTLPRRPDGAVDVSDDEWRLIEPLLCQPERARRSRQHHPRQLFDGVLRKLVLGTAWRNTPYVVGSATNALFAYRQWNRSGALQAALFVLRRCRMRIVA
jgi:hypothetical protein